MPSAKDLREFRGFLRNATDRQVQGIYDKEQRAGRDEYAELAVAEAERRGIELDEIGHSAKKKSPAQLDREIAATIVAKIRPGDRVTIVDRFGKQSTGRAVMRGPYGWVLNMGGKHGTPAIATHDNTVAVRCGSSSSVRPAQANATKRAVPGVAKWSMSAGGTSAAKGKYGYTFTVPEGAYHILPFTTKFGRHAGYSLRFSATAGRPRGSHGGLWHDLGTHRSPAVAASTAAKHYAKGFE